MTEIKTILHPTDYSEQSGCAFEYACSVARDHGARVIVLHVLTSPLATFGGMEALPPGPEELNTAAAKRQLETVQCPDASIPIDRRLVIGDPAEVIVRVAADTCSELIVMGTHGRGGLARLLMGSVAEKVLRNATCPVLTVKAPVPTVQATPEPSATSQKGITIY